MLDAARAKVGLALLASEVYEESTVEIPCIPLSQNEPEPMTYQYALSSPYRELRESMVEAKFEGS